MPTVSEFLVHLATLLDYREGSMPVRLGIDPEGYLRTYAELASDCRSYATISLNEYTLQPKPIPHQELWPKPEKKKTAVKRKPKTKAKTKRKTTSRNRKAPSC